MKPTPGLITNVGQYPISSTPLLCSGPLARRSEDLFPLYRLLKHHSRSFAEKNEDGIEEELEKTMEHSEKMDKLYDSLDLSELIVFSVPSIEIFGCQPSSDLVRV